MARGKSSEKVSKRAKKQKSTEKIEFHDCESDSEVINTESEPTQNDLSLITQNLEDPTAFYRELQEIVSTTQQLLVKFDNKYKPTSQPYPKKTHRKTAKITESDRSISSSKSLLLEIHIQAQPNNIMYHQVSTLNENMFQVLPAQTPIEKLSHQSQKLDTNCVQNIEKPIICIDQQKPNCIAGDNKNNIKTASQTNIPEKPIYLTPKTSASYFSILPTSKVDIQLLHSHSKLLTLQTPAYEKSSQSFKTSKPSETLKKLQKSKQKESSEVDLDRPDNSICGSGTNIVFQSSTISSYMESYVERERNSNRTCKIPRRRHLSPKVSRTPYQKRNLKRKQKTTSGSMHQSFPQFLLPPEFSALTANGQTMPAIVMFMPPSQGSQNSKPLNPIPLQALCIPCMNFADQTQKIVPSSNSMLNSECSSGTVKQCVFSSSDSKVQQHDVNTEPTQCSNTSLKIEKTLITTNSESSCCCPHEMQDQCVIVTPLNEPIEDELECHNCESDSTLVPSECPIDTLPPAPEPEEPMGVCCARKEREKCVECENITAEERELKPLMKQSNNYKKECFCGLKYSATPNTQVPCTCNADGQLNEDCKLPVCVEKYGVCPCDCSNKNSIVKCCREAFESTCICTDYNLPKNFRLALPQHKDLNLCIKCRFDPSPLIDSDGRVFCPGDCGCCLCPWQPRATFSKENLIMHEKVRICVCRERGTIFNLSPKNSKCTNPGNFDLCPCRERAEAKFLELYEKEMFKINYRELNELSGPPVTLKDVHEVIPLKEKQKTPIRKKY